MCLYGKVLQRDAAVRRTLGIESCQYFGFIGLRGCPKIFGAIVLGTQSKTTIWTAYSCKPQFSTPALNYLPSMPCTTLFIEPHFLHALNADLGRISHPARHHKPTQNHNNKGLTRMQTLAHAYDWLFPEALLLFKEAFNNL